MVQDPRQVRGTGRIGNHKIQIVYQGWIGTWRGGSVAPINHKPNLLSTGRHIDAVVICSSLSNRTGQESILLDQFCRTKAIDNSPSKFEIWTYISCVVGSIEESCFNQGRRR